MTNPPAPGANGASAPPEQTPAAEAEREAPARAFFEALFDVVLDEIERNPGFADRLSEKLGGVAPLRLVVKGRRRGREEPPPALAALDLPELLREEGQMALRERLSAFTNPQLAALIRARQLSSDPVSKLNKSQLANILVRAARDA
ncbi:MAG: hypothetical protein AAF909_05960 [Pseudomonadota bacterium]